MSTKSERCNNNDSRCCQHTVYIDHCVHKSKLMHVIQLSCSACSVVLIKLITLRPVHRSSHVVTTLKTAFDAVLRSKDQFEDPAIIDLDNLHEVSISDTPLACVVCSAVQIPVDINATYLRCSKRRNNPQRLHVQWHDVRESYHGPGS